MKREYKILDGYSEKSFNKLGAKGWELAFVDTNWHPMFIFKRQLKK